MYSESRDEYENTIYGIHENLKTFKKAGICNEDIAVIVLMDGIKKVDPSMKEIFKEQDSVKNIPERKTLTFREKVFDNPNNEEFAKYPRDSCYMYQVNMKPEAQNDEDDDFNYLNVFLCCKLENAGKLSSHLWFFRGFCEMFNPDYCALIDCGTKPKHNALFELFKAFECDKQVGGVCGYMGLYPEPIVDEFGVRVDQDTYKELDFFSKFCMIFFDIQKAQVFEYSFGHILDKSFESFFGFIHVLPGAFSGYRWDALRTKITDTKNILDNEYLKTVLDKDYMKSDKFTIQNANMYLAEDRILCLEIFSRDNYILKYIPEALCWTDPVKYLVMLMNQRRRWINGSWFALYYVLTACWGKILTSKHTFFRRGAFYFSMFYSIITLFTAYFAVGFYYVFLNMVAFEFFAQYNFYGDLSNETASLAGVIMFVYILLVAGLFFYSLLYKSKEAVAKFQLISSLLGMYMLISFGYMAYIIIEIIFLDNGGVAGKKIQTVNTLTDIQENIELDKYTVTVLYDAATLQALVSINILCYIIPVLINPLKSLVDILFSTKDYLFYAPAYVHTLLIYAFCNIDDLSWGTKGMDAASSLDEKGLKFKCSYVYKWLMLNMLVAYVCSILNYSTIFKNYFILVMGYYFTFGLGFKAFLAIIYHFKYYIIERLIYSFTMNEKKGEYQVKSNEMKKYINSKIRKAAVPLVRPNLMTNLKPANDAASKKNAGDNKKNASEIRSKKNNDSSSKKKRNLDNIGNVDKKKEEKTHMIIDSINLDNHEGNLDIGFDKK